MKTLTIEQIRSFGPCYDPARYLPETFNGTLKDILENKKIPVKDRLWVVVRADCLSVLQLKYYALACARLAEKYSKDSEVKACNDATERYLKGEIILEEFQIFRNSLRAMSDPPALAAYYAASAAAYVAHNYAISIAANEANSVAYYAATAASTSDDAVVYNNAVYSAAYSVPAAVNSATSDAANPISVTSYSTTVSEMHKLQCLELIKILENN